MQAFQAGDRTAGAAWLVLMSSREPSVLSHHKLRRSNRRAIANRFIAFASALAQTARLKLGAGETGETMLSIEVANRSM